VINGTNFQRMAIYEHENNEMKPLYVNVSATPSQVKAYFLILF
jgi:hypothetical protein